MKDPNCKICSGDCIHGEQSIEVELLEIERLRAQLAGALTENANLRAERDGARMEAQGAKRDRETRQAGQMRLLDAIAQHLGIETGLAIAEDPTVVVTEGKLLEARTVIDIAARQLAHAHRTDVAEVKLALYDDARALLHSRVGGP